MAIIPRTGAVKSQDLPFELGESHPAAVGTIEIEKLLGTIFELEDGLQAHLVVAGAAQTFNATSARNLAFRYSDTEAREVVITDGVGQAIVGFSHPDQEDLALGDLFFLIKGSHGHGRLTGLASAAIAKSAVLESAADGKLVTAGGGYVAHVTPGQALEATAGGDELVDVLINDLLPGAVV